VASEDRLDRSVVRGMVADYDKRIGVVEETARGNADLGPSDLLQVGLVTLATREQELYMQRFKERIISRKIVQALVAQAGRLLDGAKVGGKAGYEAAAQQVVGFPFSFRLALALHYRLGYQHWLATKLADRFETLLISRMCLQQLTVFNQRHIGPLLGATTGTRLTDILSGRLAATEKALEALRLQYPDYARTLEERYLGRVAARLEDAEFRTMLKDAMISREVFNDLNRQLRSRWHELDRRPALDIELKREELIARLPLCRGLDERRVRSIARLLRPRLALPDERIVSRGESGDAMYFIASGAVEVRIEPQPVRLGSGDFFGEIALLTKRTRTADVVALGYCHLLSLAARDFHRLLDADPTLRMRIDEVARDRLSATAGQ
jgi:CPA1 family monovalent cation:H+ antiporter